MIGEKMRMVWRIKKDGDFSLRFEIAARKVTWEELFLVIRRELRDWELGPRGGYEAIKVL